jgi:hypothetical protein
MEDSLPTPTPYYRTISAVRVTLVFSGRIAEENGGNRRLFFSSSSFVVTYL